MAEKSNGLSARLSPLAVWALSFGCILGWGAFVMPGSTLLPMAGPVGTIVALCIGACAMIVIAASFSYMATRHPDASGAFVYVKRAFGYDHAFLFSWALTLAYIAILWANATAIVLIARFLLGPVFQVGFHYTVAGYDVYLGEVLITLATLAAFALISCTSLKFVTALNTGLAVGLFLGTALCLFFVASQLGITAGNFSPGFVPDENPIPQILSIVTLAPWAFVGFEAVSHSAESYSFSVRKLFPILFIAITCGALVYIATTAMSVIGSPDTYANWWEYISDLGNLDGLTALPLFHALDAATGGSGLLLLALTVICALSTSLLGLYFTASRILCTLSRHSVFSPWFGELKSDGVPRNAILFLLALSIPVPFVGRAAIGWIVDVTSISASLAYLYISLCCIRTARDERNTPMRVVGAVGALFSTVFFVIPLLPNIWSMSALATESYLILAAWSILGLVIFRHVFKRDQEGRFGRSTIVWISMLFLIFFSSTMWVRQATNETTSLVVSKISTYYIEEYRNHGILLDKHDAEEEEAYLTDRSNQVQRSIQENSLIQMALIVFSLGIMLSIYTLIRKREREHDLQRMEAEQSNKAKTTFLSNMSHDIRTPMNAIIGYTNIAQREDTTLEETREYLKKIDASSQHLLALINDVLEMSRIESGKMDLEPMETNLVETIHEAHDMFATQMQEKQIAFTVDVSEVTHSTVMCDKVRLNRVLLNLLSNAYKFTPEGGRVTVVLRECAIQGEEDSGLARYELHVKDSGIGMAPEFAEKVFDAFERERTSTVSGIQGTGLGMAITKSIVELMGGTIGIRTAPGQGTEFIVDVCFPVVEVSEADLELAAGSNDADSVDFSTKRLLVVEDNEINLEIATFVLEDLGFEVDMAENGEEALNKVRDADSGTYDAILMDIQMPVMNGYEATRAIRKLDDPGKANVPIVACSANAFQEDIQASRDAGMNDHLSKPLDVPVVVDVLTKLFS